MPPPPPARSPASPRRCRARRSGANRATSIPRCSQWLSSPSRASCVRASCTVVRETPVRALSSASRSGVPGGSAPERNSSRRASATRSAVLSCWIERGLGGVEPNRFSPESPRQWRLIRRSRDDLTQTSAMVVTSSSLTSRRRRRARFPPQPSGCSGCRRLAFGTRPPRTARVRREIDDETVDGVGNEPLVHREAHRCERRAGESSPARCRESRPGTIALPACLVIHREPFLEREMWRPPPGDPS